VVAEDPVVDDTCGSRTLPFWTVVDEEDRRPWSWVVAPAAVVVVAPAAVVVVAPGRWLAGWSPACSQAAAMEDGRNRSSAV